MSEKIPLLDTRLGTRLRQLQQDARAKRRDQIDDWVGRHSTPDGIQRLGVAFAKFIEDQANTYETRAKGGEGRAGFRFESTFHQMGGSIPGTVDYESQRLAEFQNLAIPHVEQHLQRQFGFTEVKIACRLQEGHFLLEVVF